MATHASVDEKINSLVASLNFPSLSFDNGFQLKQTNKNPDPSFFFLSSGYTINTLNYTEKQLDWLDAHVQMFEAAVLEGRHLNWLETFLVDWFKRWPENPHGIYYEEEEEEEDRLARKQGILSHLTKRLGDDWYRSAENETEESTQIKRGILDYLYQFNDKYSSNDADVKDGDIRKILD
ncbi:hypothetical protein EV421DRAFT_1742186 [Armillaria borealis]|uniref:Uncharacterized protein n=1 Tax=Armillaria borealis TaxID=47425 RepID=A0AA39MGJ5_9AGAR|nr:hypothetical protein EV421DRAFT_1742186 [Armillaria borealis]